jgi:hypothetical protein
MKNLKSTLTAKEVRDLNLNENDVLGYDYESAGELDNYYLNVNSVRVLSFSNAGDRRKSYNKIKKMGFGFGTTPPQLTDEEAGLIQASENGENPFKCSIMCSNPELNETEKLTATRLEEFKALNCKRKPTQGHLQGLTEKEYQRLNSLHSFFMSSEDKKLQLANFLIESK